MTSLTMAVPPGISNPADVVHHAPCDHLGTPESTANAGRVEGCEAPATATHHIGKLGTTFEDDFFLSFRELTKQEQHEVIERLEYTKNRLLTLTETTPNNHMGNPIELQDNQDNRDVPRTALHSDVALVAETDSRLCALPEEASGGEDLSAEHDGISRPIDPGKNGCILLESDKHLNRIDELD